MSRAEATSYMCLQGSGSWEVDAGTVTRPKIVSLEEQMSKSLIRGGTPPIHDYTGLSSQEFRK